MGRLLDPALRFGDQDAIQLAEWVSSDAALANLKTASLLSRELCAEIDDSLSPFLNEIAGTRGMRFAQALAEYAAFIQATAYLTVSGGLAKCPDEVLGKRLRVPDIPLDAIMRSPWRFGDAVERLLGTRGVAISRVPYAMDGGLPKSRWYRWAGWLRRGIRSPFGTMSRIAERVLLRLRSRRPGECMRRPLIVTTAPFLAPQNLGVARFWRFDWLLVDETALATQETMHGGRAEFEKRASALLEDLSRGDAGVIDAAVRRLLREDIVAEITYRLWVDGYLDKLTALRTLLVERRPSLGLWSVPPTFGFPRLVFEYLTQKGIAVVGYQHGGPCGNQHGLETVLPELTKCTDFVTWGCTEEDIRRTFPWERIPCRIHPVGRLKTVSPPSGGSPDFDILFPLTNTTNLFGGGMLREKPELLLAKQVALLRYLDSLENVRVAVKPFPNATPADCGVWDQLHSLKRARVFWGVSLDAFIETYRVRAVVIEHPSTPLYDVLGLDAEVFVHLDSVLRLEREARAELELRAHCFDDLTPMMAALDAFVAGRLPPRRDDTFFRHYVSHPQARDRFVKVIEAVAAGAVAPDPHRARLLS